MPDVKINDLTLAGSISDNMQFEIDIAGSTANKVTALQLKNYIGSGSLTDLPGTRTDSITQRTNERYQFNWRIGDDQAWNAQLPDDTIIIDARLSFHVEDPNNYWMGIGFFSIVFNEAHPTAVWFPGGGWDEAWNWWGGDPGVWNWNFFSTTAENYPFTGTSGTDNKFNINAYRSGTSAFIGMENRSGFPMQCHGTLNCIIE